MHIITRKRLLDFAQKHPDCKSGLEAWYRIIKHSEIRTFAKLRKVFPSADHVGKTAIWQGEENSHTFVSFLLRIKAKKEIVDPWFLWELLNCKRRMGYFKQKSV